MCSETYIPILEQNHLTQSLLYNKVLNISYNVLKKCIKSENQNVKWMQNGCKTVFQL